MFHQSWEDAGNHAFQEIRSKGTWTCPCSSCVLVRARCFLCKAVGTCMNCGAPTKSRKANWCGPACRQQAYRVRRRLKSGG